MRAITAAYEALLHRRADWRAFSSGMPWLEHDAVIIGQSSGPGGTRPRRQSYEVYVRGRLVAQRPSLSEAQAYVIERHGPVEWHTARQDPVEVEHYFFGPTKEFSSPMTYWYADGL